jgi:hypothetical protein
MGRGEEREKHGSDKGRSKSEDPGDKSKTDLKEREYRDKEGNIHYHTRTYMEQHKAESGGEKEGGRSEGRSGGRSEGGGGRGSADPHSPSPGRPDTKGGGRKP